MKKNIDTIIFWGGVWGLIEATLGYVLHLFSLSIGWLLWFPMAFCFMNKVYKRTKSPGSILCVSFTAAIIKLVDFLLPTGIDRVINPAVSILLEGLIVFVIFKVLEHKKKGFFSFKFPEIFAASIGWRLLYIVYIMLMPAYFINISPLRAINPFLKFLFLESITNSFIIYAYIKNTEKINEREMKEKQVKEAGWFSRALLSFSMLALAVYVQWAL